MERLTHVLEQDGYLLLFLFAGTAADSMGLTAISNAIGSFMAGLSNIIIALLILILGSATAQFAGRAVSEAVANSVFLEEVVKQ